MNNSLISSKTNLKEIVLIFYPFIIVIFIFIWLIINQIDLIPLVGGLQDFSNRFVPPIKKGLFPYINFPFEYPPLFFYVFSAATFLISLFKIHIVGLFFVQFYIYIPFFYYLYLIFVPPERIMGALILLFLSIPLSAATFDYIPAIISVLFLLFLRRKRYLISSVFLAIAVGLKLYPLIYFPLLFLNKKGLLKNLIYLATFLLASFIPFLLFIYKGGFSGIVAFVSYHFFRGIQVESVPATVLYLLHIGRSFIGSAHVSEHTINANFGVIGASVIFLSSVLFWILLVIILFSSVKRFNSQVNQPSNDANVFEVALALTLCTIVTSKVLSPQFITWFIFLTPFLSEETFSKVFPISAMVVALTFLELNFYPTYLYDYGNIIITLPLIFRNLLLVGLTIMVTLPYLEFIKSYFSSLVRVKT